jgi:hypothetical protein
MLIRFHLFWNWGLLSFAGYWKFAKTCRAVSYREAVPTFPMLCSGEIHTAESHTTYALWPKSYATSFYLSLRLKNLRTIDSKAFWWLLVRKANGWPNVPRVSWSGNRPILQNKSQPFAVSTNHCKETLWYPELSIGLRYAQVSRVRTQGLCPEPWWRRGGANVNDMTLFWRWGHKWSIHASYSSHMLHKTRSSPGNIWGGRKHWIFWWAWA